MFVYSSFTHALFSWTTATLREVPDGRVSESSGAFMMLMKISYLCACFIVHQSCKVLVC